MDKIKEVCQIQVGEGFKARVDESGNILIEKEKFVPKDGDIIYTKSVYNGYISIFKIRNGNSISTYCDYCIGSGILASSESLMYKAQVVEMRLATEEEKGKLFDKLKVNGDIWNPNTKTLDKNYIPKDGDIIFNQNAIAIFNRFEGNTVKTYCSYFYHANVLYVGNNLAGSDNYFCNINSFNPRLATEAEKLVLFEQLKKKKDLVWNAETKTLEKIYIPEKGDYIYISTLGTAYIAIYNSELREQNLMLVSCFYSSNSLFSYSLYDTVPISTLHISSIRKATKEEINNLDNQISKKNLAWNSDLKILHVIPKIGNVCIFWNLLSENAVIDILERVTSSSFLASKQGFYDKCIPYNEELYKKMIRYVKA